MQYNCAVRRFPALHAPSCSCEAPPLLVCPHLSLQSWLGRHCEFLYAPLNDERGLHLKRLRLKLVVDLPVHLCSILKSLLHFLVDPASAAAFFTQISNP